MENLTDNSISSPEVLHDSTVIQNVLFFNAHHPSAGVFSVKANDGISLSTPVPTPRVASRKLGSSTITPLQQFEFSDKYHKMNKHRVEVLATPYNDSRQVELAAIRSAEALQKLRSQGFAARYGVEPSATEKQSNRFFEGIDWVPPARPSTQSSTSSSSVSESSSPSPVSAQHQQSASNAKSANASPLRPLLGVKMNYSSSHVKDSLRAEQKDSSSFSTIECPTKNEDDSSFGCPIVSGTQENFFQKQSVHVNKNKNTNNIDENNKHKDICTNIDNTSNNNDRGHNKTPLENELKDFSTSLISAESKSQKFSFFQRNVHQNENEENKIQTDRSLATDSTLTSRQQSDNPQTPTELPLFSGRVVTLRQDCESPPRPLRALWHRLKEIDVVISERSKRATKDGGGSKCDETASKSGEPLSSQETVAAVSCPLQDVYLPKKRNMESEWGVIEEGEEEEDGEEQK
eukprot:GDKK01047149.1.p1 GENE.GDKK01047149.1~~GDKK01047149.1.p1  ORF type:complete len:461 (-),score=98.91 GDKK01047149.1:290-1672(-)